MNVALRRQASQLAYFTDPNEIAQIVKAPWPDATNILFNAARLKVAAEATDQASPLAEPTPQPREDDEPRLCPDPGWDVPHGASAASQRYQSWVTGLPAGMAVWFNGVSFDGCKEDTGALLEAKGKDYAWAIDDDGQVKGNYQGFIGMFAQAIRQNDAAGARVVEWHVAEPSVAAFLEREFARQGLTRLVVMFTPPPS